jgi:hypothetical protein
MANIDARAIYRDIETKGSSEFVCATHFALQLNVRLIF